MTYEEFAQQPELVQFWAKKISEEDGRPAHPEDYVVYANKLMDKSDKNCPQRFKTSADYANKMFDEESRLFEMVVALDNHRPCHRDFCYSFLDWFDYVIGR